MYLTFRFDARLSSQGAKSTFSIASMGLQCVFCLIAPQCLYLYPYLYTFSQYLPQPNNFLHLATVILTHCHLYQSKYILYSLPFYRLILPVTYKKPMAFFLARRYPQLQSSTLYSPC
ncbi:hypothetical protein K435DRAFT_333041 [Dendrothele bispora CBS 962.96]|uniref:Uncharacterized protein n=1 Tax=Dendrothele bispora (strain CBS 962.96) TaxID=1314807 RepID=A0A4S8MVS7_DENBC|nr:hypothetical protein K435DRAFT_333041 [Dendrothele bispora CBS 962.96]